MASDIFAKIGDIKGESLDDKHKGEIEVLSWSWGVSNAGEMRGGSGGGEGKASFRDLSFTHNIDKASPVLLQACATGVHLKEATITHRKAGKGQQRVPDRQDERRHHHRRGTRRHQRRWPRGERDSAFAKIDFQYKPQKPDGTLEAGIHFKYDIKGNKEG